MRRALVSVLALSTITPAYADEDATALFKAGVAELRVGALPEAAEHFRRSSELEPRTATFCNLALTYDRWTGHEREAREAYLSCAAHDDSGRFREHALLRAHELELEHELASAPPPAKTEPTPAPPDPTPTPVVITPPQPQPQPRARPSHRLAIVGGVLGGVGLACLGTAIGLEVHAGHTLGGLVLPGTTQIPTSEHGAYDRAHDEARAGIGLYAATGVLGVSALALLVTDAVRAHRARTR